MICLARCQNKTKKKTKRENKIGLLAHPTYFARPSDMIYAFTCQISISRALWDVVCLLFLHDSASISHHNHIHLRRYYLIYLIPFRLTTLLLFRSTIRTSHIELTLPSIHDTNSTEIITHIPSRPKAQHKKFKMTGGKSGGKASGSKTAQS